MSDTLVTSPQQLLAAAFVIGLTGAMSPGPYLTVTIARTITDGRRSALLMLVGHAILEALLLVGFAFGLQRFLAEPIVNRVMAVVGGAVLLWMGGTLLYGAVRGTITADLHAAEDTSRLGPVARGALVSLSNPWWTLWWATIGVTLAAQGLAFGPVGVAAFFVGHQLADVVWYSAVIFAVSAGRHLLSDGVYRFIMAGLACVLLFIGGRFLLAGVVPIG